jgi:hypothetical protein
MTFGSGNSAYIPEPLDRLEDVAQGFNPAHQVSSISTALVKWRVVLRDYHRGFRITLVAVTQG